MTQRADSDRVLHALDDKPGWGLSLLLGLTHVSLISDGIIFLPIMIGKATPLGQVAFVTFATILVAALGTLVQILQMGGCFVTPVLPSGESRAKPRVQAQNTPHARFF